MRGGRTRLPARPGAAATGLCLFPAPDRAHRLSSDCASLRYADARGRTRRRRAPGARRRAGAARRRAARARARLRALRLRRREARPPAARERCSGTRSPASSRTARASPSCTASRAASASAAAPGTSRRAASSRRCGSSRAASPRCCARRTACRCPTRSTSSPASGSSRSRACCARASACRAAACSSSAAAPSACSGCRRCSARGDEVVAADLRPDRLERALELGARADDDPVDAAVLAAHGGLNDALARLEPGGTLVVFAAPEDDVPTALDAVYRKELTRRRLALRRRPPTSATRSSCCPPLELPRPLVAAARALRRGARRLPLRRGAEGRLHAVRAARFHAPGDVRLEEVPDPKPGPGDVLVQVEVALTDGTDLKTFRRGHPLLLARDRRARSGTSSRASRSRPAAASSRPTRRRAARAPAAAAASSASTSRRC